MARTTLTDEVCIRFGCILRGLIARLILVCHQIQILATGFIALRSMAGSQLESPNQDEFVRSLYKDASLTQGLLDLYIHRYPGPSLSRSRCFAIGLRSVDVIKFSITSLLCYNIFADRSPNTLPISNCSSFPTNPAFPTRIPTLSLPVQKSARYLTRRALAV